MWANRSLERSVAESGDAQIESEVTLTGRESGSDGENGAAERDQIDGGGIETERVNRSSVLNLCLVSFSTLSV